MSGGIVLPLLRGLHLAAMLSLFGLLVFRRVVLPADHSDQATPRRLAGFTRISAALALVLGAAWFCTETAALAGVTRLGAVAGFLPVVALHTQFGSWLALRLGMLLLLLPARSAACWPGLVLAGAAVAMQPMLAHAGAEPGRFGSLLVADEAVHLLAAGAWLGGLLPLWLTLHHLPAREAIAACVRFSRLGVIAVCLVALSGLLLGAGMLGGLPNLWNSDYGHFILLKTGLFALALALAGLNRFVFAPGLRAGERRGLLVSVAIEMAIGFAIVLAAGFLAARMPGADMPHHMAGARSAPWQMARSGRGSHGAAIAAVALYRRPA